MGDLAHTLDRIDTIGDESKFAAASSDDYKWWETGIIVSPFVIAFLIFIIIILVLLYVYKPFLSSKENDASKAIDTDEYASLEEGIAKTGKDKPNTLPVK